MNKSSIIFILVIMVVTALLEWFSYSLTTYHRQIILSQAILTGLVYAILQRAKESDPAGFIGKYISSIVVKLVVSGIIIFILIKTDSAGAQANAVLFMISYLIYTGLEVAFLSLHKS